MFSTTRYQVHSVYTRPSFNTASFSSVVVMLCRVRCGHPEIDEPGACELDESGRTAEKKTTSVNPPKSLFPGRESSCR